MAKKEVGRKGRALIKPTVAGKGGGRLPISRTTHKQRGAMDVLIPNIMVDLNGKPFSFLPHSNDQLYRFVSEIGYRWDGEKWTRKYPEWVKVES